MAWTSKKYRPSTRTQIEQRQYDVERKNKAKREAFDILGNCCKKCGFSDWRALQIDHVNNDGWKDKVLYGCRITGRRLYDLVIRTKGVGFQLLCANCNFIKQFEKDGYINPDVMEKVIQVL